MALPTLPYPSMDFTPLDVLTAAELDQMVANIEYLRTYAESLADGTNATQVMPDYATAPTQVTTFPYTATANGYLRISTANNKAVSVNSRNVAQGEAFAWVAIAVGDIVNTSSPSEVSVYLFPQRVITA